MKIDKERIKRIVYRVIEMRLSQQWKKEGQLTDKDREMFDRIFGRPEPEPEYQDHFALTDEWQKKHKKTKSTKR